MFPVRNLLVLSAVLVASTGAFGAEAPKPELKPDPILALKEFEGSAEHDYTLGEGDELSVEVVGRAELSGRHIIGPDGRITLPVAGTLMIRDLTRDAAAKAITSALAKYYEDLSVTVRVEKYGSNKVLLIGHVTHPGLITFDGPPTLLEVLTKGGSPGPNNTETLPHRCAIYRGKDQVLWVNIRQLLTEGNTAVNLRLRRNDTIYVPDDQEDTVSVLGDVQHPGAFPIKSDTKLTEVLAMAGGLTDMANSGHIRLVRPSTGVTRELALKELLTPKGAAEVSLQRGDIVYVPRSGFAQFSTSLQKLGPAAAFLLFGATLGR